MRPQFIVFFTLVLFSIGCQSPKDKALSAFGAFCEMVANDAKPIALSAPMSPEELDIVWEDYQTVAAAYEVSLFREQDFPVTSLFPASITEGKEVVIVYSGSRRVQYEQFKKDLGHMDPESAARRFGRLLGYTPQGTNSLLMKNTSYKTLVSFGVKQQITHLYYQDLEEADRFYKEVLGLSFSEDKGYGIGENASIKLHSVNDDHPDGQSKSTAIALLTDQLPQWYEYLQEQQVPIKYTYKPREGGPHDGFVAIDPGGYLLEFEQFKQHPENELFMAELADATKIHTTIEPLYFYGSITWTYHNDLLKMQRFYEEVLGYRMVADQGWTKIYQTSPTGFIGLVDERRGMMDYADDKAVEVEWRLSRQEEAAQYFSKLNGWESDWNGFVGPEQYRYRVR